MKRLLHWLTRTTELISRSFTKLSKRGNFQMLSKWSCVVAVLLCLGLRKPAEGPAI